MAEKFKTEKNLDFFVEASAKTGHNVENAFITIAKMLYKKNKSKISDYI
jgi:hypothetical protein